MGRVDVLKGGMKKGRGGKVECALGDRWGIMGVRWSGCDGEG